jgi:hypothetical protein
MSNGKPRKSLLASLAMLALLPAGEVLSQQPTPTRAASAADEIAHVFGQVGGQVYEHCIFELSQEQIEVQQALIVAYIRAGATSALARQLAAKQIRPPKTTDECKQIRGAARSAPPAEAAAPPAPQPAARPPKVTLLPKPSARTPSPPISIADKAVLPQWDCAPGVDYVTIQHRGYERKLTDGEICSPFDDVVHAVPDTFKNFRLGYTIKTGRLFVLAADQQPSGRTIAWAISGREACRNNPDPDCLATRAVGPLPPGKYAFAAGKNHKVTWGPKTKRMVAAVYLTKLWSRERFTPAQTAAILKRGDIAIHVRLKGEMSEACLGLEPKGWAYVSALIKDGRATGLDVFIDEPYPQIAEAPPVVRVSSFSLSSLFK